MAHPSQLRNTRSLLLVALPLVTFLLGASSGPVAAQADRMSASERLERFDMHRSMVESSLFVTLPWQHLGPTNISGRVTDVAVAEPRGETYICTWEELPEASGRPSTRA